MYNLPAIRDGYFKDKVNLKLVQHKTLQLSDMTNKMQLILRQRRYYNEQGNSVHKYYTTNPFEY